MGLEVRCKGRQISNFFISFIRTSQKSSCLSYISLLFGLALFTTHLWSLLQGTFLPVLELWLCVCTDVHDIGALICQKVLDLISIIEYVLNIINEQFQNKMASSRFPCNTLLVEIVFYRMGKLQKETTNTFLDVKRSIFLFLQLEQTYAKALKILKKNAEELCVEFGK